jgi:hypothetical protein
MTKHEILTDAHTQRQDEVLGYQINIDNYRIAIDLAKKDPELTAFVQQLQELLNTSIFEQKKASIMLQVIQQQLEDI